MPSYVSIVNASVNECDAVSRFTVLTRRGAGGIPTCWEKDCPIWLPKYISMSCQPPVAKLKKSINSSYELPPVSTKDTVAPPCIVVVPNIVSVVLAAMGFEKLITGAPGCELMPGLAIALHPKTNTLVASVFVPVM